MAVTPPYAHKVIRVTISGDCFSGAEHWTTGFYLGDTAADAGDPAGCADDIAGYWTTFFTTAANKVGSAYRTLEVKAALIKADGHTDLESIDYYTYPTPIVGVTATSVLPPQVTLAATLTSDVQRGLGAKGRMYLPGIWDGVSTTNGKLASTTPSNIKNNLKTFLDSVNADSDIPGYVILASHGHYFKDSLGVIEGYTGAVNTRVTGCRVGDVYDTQRRRRDDLPEVYYTAVLA